MEESKVDSTTNSSLPQKRRRNRKRQKKIQSFGCLSLVILVFVGVYIFIDQKFGSPPFLIVLIFIGILLNFFKDLFKPKGGGGTFKGGGYKGRY